MTKREVEEYIMSQIFPNASHEVTAQNVRNAFAPIVERVWTFLEGEIGDLSQLQTTDKQSVVNAINAVLSKLNHDITLTKQEIANLGLKVGELSELETTDKTNLVKAINELSKKEIEVDTTLSQSGKAGDAKAVGDAINDVKTELNGFDHRFVIPITSTSKNVVKNIPITLLTNTDYVVSFSGDCFTKVLQFDFYEGETRKLSRYNIDSGSSITMTTGDYNVDSVKITIVPADILSIGDFVFNIAQKKNDGLKQQVSELASLVADISEESSSVKLECEAINFRLDGISKHIDSKTVVGKDTVATYEANLPLGNAYRFKVSGFATLINQFSLIYTDGTQNNQYNKKLDTWFSITPSKQVKSVYIYIAKNNILASGDMSIDIDFTKDAIVSRIENLEEDTSNIVGRNRHRLNVLNAISGTEIGGTTTHHFTALLHSDMHGEMKSLENAITYANSNSLIDAVFVLGDQVRSYSKKSEFDGVRALVSQSTKPVLIVCGNHDAGAYAYLGAISNNKQVYDRMMTIMIDKGWLTPANFDVNASTEGKPYYFKDFSATKTRVISLYQYDIDIKSDYFKTDYWRQIAYNSSYPDISTNTSYSVGAKVNVADMTEYGYSEYSFECVQAVTTPKTFITDDSETWGKYPSLLFSRNSALLSKTQTEWYRDVLMSTPSGYSIIVIMHAGFSSNSSAQHQYKFCAKRASKCPASSFDYISELTQHYINGDDGVLHVTKPSTVTSDLPYFTEFDVSYDFRSKSDAKFICFVNGHGHYDAIWKHNIYPLMQIQTTTANPNQTYFLKDMTRAKSDSMSYDCLTIMAVDRVDNKIKLMKIGQTTTIDLDERDQETIDIL